MDYIQKSDEKAREYNKYSKQFQGFNQTSLSDRMHWKI